VTTDTHQPLKTWCNFDKVLARAGFMATSPTQSAGCWQHPGRRRLRRHTLALLGALSLATSLSVAAPPAARAVSFTDGDTTTNPFYYDPSAPAPNSSWTLTDGGLAEAAVLLVNPTTVRFESSGEGTDTWTSGIADQEYGISFGYNFDQLEGFPDAYYQIASNSIIALTGSGTINTTLLAGQTFSFGIINNGGLGDLTISNFNATPVPAPLPLLGAGAAFGWIRRRRAQLKARQLGRQ
jgi:MYXO-CTERM domain-containing protein